MKILFINLPYYGHVIPTIGLIQELIKKDIKVTTLMPFDWEDFMKQSGADFIGYENHKQLSEQIKNCYKKAESIIQDYDLVIYEQFFFLGKHLAEKYHKPVVIHSRDAIQDTYDILKEEKLTVPIDIHCYSGSVEMAHEFIKLGAYLGIGGVVTFKNGVKLQEVVKEIDLKYLLHALVITQCFYRGRETNLPSPFVGRTYWLAMSAIPALHTCWQAQLVITGVLLAILTLLRTDFHHEATETTVWAVMCWQRPRSLKPVVRFLSTRWISTTSSVPRVPSSLQSIPCSSLWT